MAGMKFGTPTSFPLPPEVPEGNFTCDVMCVLLCFSLILLCVTHKYKAGEACRAIYNEHEHSGMWLSSKHNKKVVSTPCKLNLYIY